MSGYAVLIEHRVRRLEGLLRKVRAAMEIGEIKLYGDACDLPKEIDVLLRPAPDRKEKP